MLGNDEKKFMELRSRFLNELEELEKQMTALTDRHNELLNLLDGTVQTYSEESTYEPVSFDTFDKDQVDNLLVDFVQRNSGCKRAEIDEFFNYLHPGDVRRALDRCKRRGLIKPTGRSKSATWSAVKKIKK